MYIAGPPAAASAHPEPPGRIAVPLSRIITREFGAGAAFGAAGLKIIGDLAESYRVPFRAEQFTNGRRTTFTDMVRTLVPALSDPAAPVDLVILAHGLPDAEPEWPACYLSGVLPGGPLSFAVADGGVVTAFQALRIAAEYIRADHLRRAIVIILDQTSLLHDPMLSADLPVPTGNQMVALVFEEGGSLGTVTVEVSADSAPPVPGSSPTATVLGGTLAATLALTASPASSPAAAVTPTAASAAPGIAAPVGLPCTGGWLMLAERLAGWRDLGTEQVVLVDYDPALRITGRCVLDLSVPAPV